MAAGEFAERYGPWGAVLGAGRGIGLAFAGALARRGLRVLLIDRAPELLADAARRAESEGAPEVRTRVLDLADPGAAAALEEEAGRVDLGLGVVTAVRSLVGPFLDEPLESLLASVRVNCDGVLVACHVLGRALRARGRGGLILLSSLAGQQGTGWVAAYSAAKAFDRALAEALWWELGSHGVDVLALVAGSTDTPGFRAHAPRLDPAALQPADEVAEEGLSRLGHGPLHVSGEANRRIGAALEAMAPAERVRTISEATRALYRS